MKAFCCWSGGKESCLSCYKVIGEKIEVSYLLNMVNEDGRYSRTHRISSSLFQAQAKALGISLIQQKTTWEDYEKEFKKIVLKLKEKGIQIGVFGDISLKEHRDWVERVCKDIGIKPLLPLWKKKRENLLKEFIQAGFKAIVVSCADFLGKKWLGRKIDKEFIEDLKALRRVDLCGERGEYHTFVYDGPIFKNPIEFTFGKKIFKDRHWLLELKLLTFA